MTGFLLACEHPPPPLKKIGKRDVCVAASLIVFRTVGIFPECRESTLIGYHCNLRYVRHLPSSIWLIDHFLPITLQPRDL